MNVSAMDELNLDDLFGGKGDGDALFPMEDLVMDFGGEDGNEPDLGLEMKWDDPALANITPVEGEAANVTPILPEQAPKKKEKKKKRKKEKNQGQQSDPNVPILDYFEQATTKDPLQQIGDKLTSKSNKSKSSKKKKPKKPKALPLSDSLVRHQYPPQAKPLPSSVMLPPPTGPNVSAHAPNQSQKPTRTTKKRKKDREVSTTSALVNTPIDIFASAPPSSDASSKKSSKRRKKEKTNDVFSQSNSLPMGLQMPSALGSVQGQIHPQLRGQLHQIKANQSTEPRNVNNATNYKNSSMDPSFYASLRGLSSLNDKPQRSKVPNDSQSPFPPLKGIDMSIDYSKTYNQTKRSMNENLQMKQNAEQEKKNYLYQLYANSNNLSSVPDKNTGPSKIVIGEKNLPLNGKNKKNSKVKNKLESISSIEKQIQNNILYSGQTTSNATKKKKQKQPNVKNIDSLSQSSPVASGLTTSIERPSKPAGSGRLFGTGRKHTTPTMLITQVKVRIDGRIRDVSNGVKNLTAHIFVPTGGIKNGINKTSIESTSTNLRPSTRNQSSTKDTDVKPKRRRNSSTSAKNSAKTTATLKPTPIPAPSPVPKKPTATNLISFLLDPSNNFTPSQRREQLFSFMSTQLQPPVKVEQNPKEKNRKTSISKKKEKQSDLVDEEVPNAISMWSYAEQENYFADIKDENVMKNLKYTWQPERIEEGPAYWGEMPPVSLVKKEKQKTDAKSASLFDRLQSLLVIVADDESENEEVQEVRNLILESSDTTASSLVQNLDGHKHDIDSDEVDISNLSLDQCTFIHLRSLQLIDRPYLPYLSPVAIENDSDDEDCYSTDSQNDQDSLDDPLFSRIHTLRKELSNINHSNNIYTANLQATVEQYISKEVQGKKQQEDAILAKYFQKKK